jgi:hypothetical protein
MMTHLLRATVVALAMVGSSTLGAQQMTQTGPGAGGSPHVKTTWTIDGAKLAISYGRPALKGRPEATLMPAGKEWRTGADTVTTLVTDKTLKFGTVTLAPGSYTINTVPGATWQLVLGKLESPGQWGVPYKPALELGRTPMTLGKTGAPVESLLISIDDTPAGATLRIEWGTTRATIPFTVEAK